MSGVRDGKDSLSLAPSPLPPLPPLPLDLLSPRLHLGFHSQPTIIFSEVWLLAFFYCENTF